MIICIFRKMFKSVLSRRIIGVSTGIAALFLALAPLFVKPEVVPFQTKQLHNYEISRNDQVLSGDVQSGIAETVDPVADALMMLMKPGIIVIPMRSLK
jgi:hypothetical protein